MAHTHGTVRSRLREIRLAKENVEKRALTLAEMSEGTGLSVNALQRLLRPGGEFERVSPDTLAALCGYFGVGIGELLEYVPPVPTEA